MINIKKASPLVSLALAGTLLAGCGNDIDRVRLQERAKQAGLPKDYLVNIASHTQVPIDSLVQYDNRFFDEKRADNIVHTDILLGHVYKRDITPSVANAYDKRFDLMDIWALYDKGITAETANGYANWNGETEEIFALIKNGITAEKAFRYASRFSFIDVLNFHNLGINGDIVNAYDSQFTSDGILHLAQAGISASEANPYTKLNEKFHVNIGFADIIYFKHKGISYETVADRAEKTMLDRMIAN